MSSKLREKYDNEMKAALSAQLGITNPMQLPRIEKVVINMGVGKSGQNPKLLEDAVLTLTRITGQKPIVTKAKKAISNFRLRENMSIGCKVTLRKERMYEFLERLISVALPRVRDFKGLNRKSFDGNGNYTFGVKENTIFLEIDRDKISQVQGMDISICTSAEDNAHALALLEHFGMPFRK